MADPSAVEMWTIVNVNTAPVENGSGRINLSRCHSRPIRSLGIRCEKGRNLLYPACKQAVDDIALIRKKPNSKQARNNTTTSDGILQTN